MGTRVSGMTVTEVSVKEVKTKFGQKPTYSFQCTDGKWYRTGFTAHGLSAGAVVDFEFEVDKYGNQVDAKTIVETGKAAPGTVVTPAAAVARPSVGGRAGVFPIPPLDGQRAIVRQNALTNARELVVAYTLPLDKKGAGLTLPQLADEIIAIARQFEAYACGDIEAESVKAEMEAK